jgi:hypothetical protein
MEADYNRDALVGAIGDLDIDLQAELLEILVGMTLTRSGKKRRRHADRLVPFLAKIQQRWGAAL